MELRQLAYFVAVAEEANFTRAAERVHISQSGVSAQVRQLERNLGATLFDRSTRTATLTPAGAVALGPARAALAAADAVRHAVDDVNGLYRGRLTLGMVTACTLAPLFDGLAAFHRPPRRRGHPGRGHVRPAGRRRALRGRRPGAGGAAGRRRRASRRTWWSASTWWPPCRPGTRWPRGHGHRPARPRRPPVVSLPVGTGVQAAFDRACARRGVRPRVAVQASAPGAVADLAARGIGVAVLSGRWRATTRAAWWPSPSPTPTSPPCWRWCGAPSAARRLSWSATAARRWCRSVEVGSRAEAALELRRSTALALSSIARR